MKWLGAGVALVLVALGLMFLIHSAQEAEMEQEKAAVIEQGQTVAQTKPDPRRGLGRFGGGKSRVENAPNPTAPATTSDQATPESGKIDVALVPAMRADTPAAQAVLQHDRIFKLVDDLVANAGTKPENANEVRQMLLDEAASIAEARRTGITSLRVVRATTDKKIAAVLTAEEFKEFQKLRRQRRLPAGVLPKPEP